jgi:hypothetical protein
MSEIYKVLSALSLDELKEVQRDLSRLINEKRAEDLLANLSIGDEVVLSESQEYWRRSGAGIVVDIDGHKVQVSWQDRVDWRPAWKLKRVRLKEGSTTEAT